MEKDTKNMCKFVVMNDEERMCNLETPRTTRFNDHELSMEYDEEYRKKYYSVVAKYSVKDDKPSR